MMYATSITIAEGDVIIFPFEVFYRLKVMSSSLSLKVMSSSLSLKGMMYATSITIDISERPLLHFLGIAVSGPTCLSSEMRSTKDSLDLRGTFATG